MHLVPGKSNSAPRFRHGCNQEQHDVTQAWSLSLSPPRCLCFLSGLSLCPTCQEQAQQSHQKASILSLVIPALSPLDQSRDHTPALGVWE